MEPKLHPLDKQIFKKDVECPPLPTFHYAKTQYLTLPLVVDVEARSNYISDDIIDILKLNVWPHPNPYYLDSHHPILFQCKLPFRVGHYEDALLCDVTTIRSVGVILGHEWIANRQIRYSMRRKAFIYPWMKKAAPQPELPSRPVSVPDVKIIAEPEHVVAKSESAPTPLAEPDPTPLPQLVPTLLPEPEPMMETAPLVEHAPMAEPEPMVETALMVDLAPMAEPEPVEDPESVPTPKFLPESAPEEVKLLHEFQDPFLPPEPDPAHGFPAFKSGGEVFLWRVTDFLIIFSVARSAAVGLHHQLLEARLCHLNSRSSFCQPGSLMRKSFGRGRANPTV